MPPELTPASSVRLAAYDASPPEGQRARYVALLLERQRCYSPWEHTWWSLFSCILSGLLYAATSGLVRGLGWWL
jgi:hypothetical protein